MERLTSRDSKGNLRLCNKEVYGNNQDIYNAIAVLEDYENTGITPDQLQVINEEYQKMAKELAELRQQNRWIPVEESLPDAFKPVIVCRKNGKVEQGIRNVNGWWKVHGTNIKSVAAWRPLPEPYKE